MKAIKIIIRNYEMITNDPVDGVSVGMDTDNVFNWNITIIGPKDSPCEGGILNATMKFPQNFPMNPPEFKFNKPLFHPNIEDNGKVCISILHPPGDDEFGYENADERWRPVHTVSSIVLSIISLLSAPNDESSANVEAGKIWREDRGKFQQIVNKCIRNTLE